RVILDHFLIGDGSPGGWRTRKTGFPERLAAAGFGEWNELAKLDVVRDLLASVLGAERVLVGCEGFNAVGGYPAEPRVWASGRPAVTPPPPDGRGAPAPKLNLPS